MLVERVQLITKKAAFNLELGLVLRNGQIGQERGYHAARNENLGR